MTNHGKSDNSSTKINMPNGNTIMIISESIYEGIISVRNKQGQALWQKANCSALDLPFAIEVANRSIQTGIFETD